MEKRERNFISVSVTELDSLAVKPKQLNSKPISQNETFTLSPMRYVAQEAIEFDTSKSLGKGSKTFVYEGKFQNRTLAIKRIPCMDHHQMDRHLDAYKPLLKCEKHVNLVELYGCYLEDAIVEVFIPMERCNGNLNQWRNGKIADIQVDYDSYPVHQVLRDISEGVAFLHSKGVIHGDLKPSNILVCQIGTQIRLKLTDYGVKQVSSSRRKEWLAPEMLQTTFDNSSSFPVKRARWDDTKMSTKSDIFSLGLIFYWILSGGRHPFGGDFVDREYNLKEYNMQFEEKHFAKLDVKVLQFLKKMLAQDPEDRPSSRELLCHPICSSNEYSEKVVKP